ncbi:MAG: dephospho-CoA kinase [Oscillospiraceae bacterium]|nr:dephospho-CoA kinase [Oscillospiraceae bacterium]
MIIGITGGSGTGKSSLANLLELEVINADCVYHKIFRENNELKNELAERFGACGRKELADIVFADRAKLEELNLVTFKYVLSAIERMILGKSSIVIDAPLLFESGLGEKCDFTVAVLAEKELRIKRIMDRDNLSRIKAEMRINAQKPDAYYITRADCLVYNNDGDLMEAARKLKKRIARLRR